MSDDEIDQPTLPQHKNGILILSDMNLDKLDQLASPAKILFLNLSNNNLKKLQNLENLKMLKELNLSHNLIDNFEGLENCKNLVTLNLSHNSLESLEFLPKLPVLRELNLNKNYLKSLKGWENLKDLKKLSAGSNRLHEIPYLPTFNKYEELILFDNKIETIQPNNFEYGTSLQFLDLSQNRLKSLQFLAPLKNLQTLLLARNLIEYVDTSLRLETLENLDLSENLIEEARDFEKIFPELFTLNLAANRILSVYELRFCGEMTYLYDLNILHNDFCNEEIEQEILEKYPNLERLNQRDVRKIGAQIKEKIKDLEKNLKNDENFEYSDPFRLDFAEDAEMKNLHRPISASLKIQTENELESQIFELREFLKTAQNDIENLRNRYITHIGKKRIKEIQRKSIQSSHESSRKFTENEENKTMNTDGNAEEIMNKSLPNFKKFIVRKQKNGNIPRSSSNAHKVHDKPLNIASVGTLPLNPLNVPAKILNSEKKEIKKLIKTSSRDQKFIEKLRENLEITGALSAPKSKNRALKAVTGVPFGYKTAFKKI